ncbi:ABC transporter permease [Reichenbachiella versicolor]|uniref:ABC transporter permease n=1 Tax=Reichenbachiella versicolor TaxID=1821036 RepID=UPI000D6E92B2|nr:ABC transporter permease [Reichenbachiella versicolor]
MNKIGLIIVREYLSRVRKKSFIIMSVLGPFIFAALFIVPVWMASTSTDDQKIIQVIDETGMFKGQLEGNKTLYFDFIEEDLLSAKSSLEVNEAFGLLHIPKMGMYDVKAIKLYSYQNPGLSIVNALNWKLQSRIENIRLKESGVSEGVIKNLKKKLKLKTIRLNKAGDESQSNAEATTAAGYIGSFLIYFFIFLYGAQIMRGVIEEKTSRIIEVIIASVKPIELMIGKIVGVAAVGLTQFLIWLLLSFGLVYGVSSFLLNSSDQKAVEQAMLESKVPNADYEVLEQSLMTVSNFDFPLLIGCFLFYFIGGYLFYGSLFAAVGSAVDSDADTQQFMLPITAPLILSVIMMTSILQEPNGSLAFWLSIIPFSSPVVMMMRLPFDVPLWHIVVSMLALCVGFIGTAMIASKIYRIGIFVHGTKVNYRTLWKWLWIRDK